MTRIQGGAMKTRIGAAVRAAVTLALVASIVPGAAAAAACADDSATGGVHPGGEWTSYGGDPQSTRSQPEETSISPANAGGLAKKWSVTVAGLAGSGSINTTPVVAGGCLYFTSSGETSGWVYALNADTGALVWKTRFTSNGGISTTFLGGAIVGTVALSDDCVSGGSPTPCVLALVSGRSQPRAVALNRSTGALLWDIVLTTFPESFINASPVVHKDKLFVGISGQESTAVARGAFAIVDIPTASVDKLTFTISDVDYAAGYRGASIWATGAVDPSTGYVYVGSGNPASKKLEHRHSNALLKIDLEETRATYGTIVDAYKGDPDQYYPGLDRQPLCDQFGDHPAFQYLAWSAACAQLDLDFGSSPNLWVDPLGHTMVGALQKSGVYHAVYADTMQRGWTNILGGLPCFPCNAASTAADSTGIFGVGTPPGAMVALTRSSGAYRWVTPVVDGLHYQGTSVAYGVVYTMTTSGLLQAFEAATGVPLFARQMQQDSGASGVSVSSGGVAIARNQVYAAQASSVISYGI